MVEDKCFFTVPGRDELKRLSHPASRRGCLLGRASIPFGVAGAGAPRSPPAVKRYICSHKLKVKSCDGSTACVWSRRSRVKTSPDASDVAVQPRAAVSECSAEDDPTAGIPSCLLRLIRLHDYDDLDVNVANFRHTVFTNCKQLDQVD